MIFLCFQEQVEQVYRLSQTRGGLRELQKEYEEYERGPRGRVARHRADRRVKPVPACGTWWSSAGRDFRATVKSWLILPALQIPHLVAMLEVTAVGAAAGWRHSINFDCV